MLSLLLFPTLQILEQDLGLQLLVRVSDGDDNQDAVLTCTPVDQAFLLQNQFDRRTSFSWGIE